MTLVAELHAIVAECSNPECYICEKVGKAAERIKALEADNLRLRKLLNEARIYVDECFGDLDRSLSVRIDAAPSSEPKQEQRPTDGFIGIVLAVVVFIAAHSLVNLYRVVLCSAP